MVCKENTFDPLNIDEIASLLAKEKIENDYSFLELANIDHVRSEMERIYKMKK